MHVLTNEHPLIVLPQLACVIGVEEALVLQQLHYRLQQLKATRKKEVWYCQSIENWQKQLPFWHKAKIKRILRTLEDLQLVQSTDKLNRFCIDRTKWYQIDYDKLFELILCYKMEHGITDDNFAQLTGFEPDNKQKTSDTTHKAQIDEVLAYLNDKAQRHFRITTKAHRNFISARLNEGYTVEDCKLVIDEQVAAWKHTDMEKFLRPQTLFRPGKFDGYLNDALKSQQKRTSATPVKLDFNAGEDL